MQIEELLADLTAGGGAARDELRRLGPGAAPAVPALCDALLHGGPRLKEDALFVLEGIGGAARAAIPAVLAVLGEASLSSAAADVLAAIGAEAVAPLLEKVRSLSAGAELRRAACLALGGMGPPAAGAVSVLLGWLESDPDSSVRKRAAWALGEIGADQALAPLARVFASEGGSLGCWIAQALGRFGRRGRAVAGVLRDELHRDDPALALAAADALRLLEAFEDQAVWALVALLQGTADRDFWLEAVEVLAGFGSRAVASVPALRALAAESEDAEVRAAALLALAAIRPEAAVSVSDPASGLRRSSERSGP